MSDQSATNATWWNATEPAVRDLAWRLARKLGLNPYDDCLPYPPLVQVVAFSSQVCIVPRHDLIPVWAAFIGLAREALATRDEQIADAQLGAFPWPTQAPEVVTLTDDTNKNWRKEVGLDDEGGET